MTYTELVNKFWASETDKDRASFKAGLDEPTLIAWKAIDTLYNRGGFDHWWDDIDNECKNDIFNDIKLAVSKVKSEIPAK